MSHRLGIAALQFAADYAASWCEDNSMLLNVTKSQSLTLTLQKNIICDPIKINDMPISQNSSVKLLGVCFDNHMRFSAHVDSVISKLRPAVHAIIQLRKVGVSTSSLVTFYRSRVLSVISYAAPSWFPFLSKGDKEILERLQKLCLRVILPWIEHYDERLAALNLTEISVYLDICCLKYVNNVRKNTSHPHHHHLHRLATNDSHHHKTTTLPKTNTAHCRKKPFL